VCVIVYDCVCVCACVCVCLCALNVGMVAETYPVSTFFCVFAAA